MSEQPTAWPPGTVLAGRYRVDGELGRGGMGVVLRAWPLVPSVQLRTDTPIALKLMLNTGGRIDQQRFEREARITAELDPTGVCAIYDAGVLDDGTPFIAMELLDGEDLDERLAREGALPPVEAVDLLLAAIDILAEAHLAGLVHRDLKPSNLFLALTPLGPQLKVLDFGIVKVLQGAHQTSVLTQTGEILGSPAYMAPEQLMDSGRVDHRIDIWALGVIVYELLSGRPPFDGQSLIDLCQAVFTAEPPPLPQFGALDMIIARCLAKNADDRFGDVAELARALAPHASATGRAWSVRTQHRFASIARAVSPRPAPVVAPSPVNDADVRPDPVERVAGRGRQRRQRRWPALVSMGVLAAVTATGAGLYWTYRADSRSPTADTEHDDRGHSTHDEENDDGRDGDGRDGDGALKLPVTSINPLERRAAATLLAREVDPQSVLVGVLVFGLRPDLQRNDRIRRESFLFTAKRTTVSIVVTPSGTKVTEEDLDDALDATPEGLPARHCPLEKVMAIAREAKPERADQTVVATLLNASTRAGDVQYTWTIADDAWGSLSIDEDCRVRDVANED